MSEEDDFDLRLSARLGEELRQQLDRQLGRAAPFFLTRYDAHSDGRPATRRRRGRLLAGLAAIAAASCAAFIAWEWHRPENLPDGPVDKIAVAVESQNVAANHTDEAPSDEGGHSGSDGKRPSSSNRDSSTAAGALGSDPFILASALSTRTLDDGVLLVGRTPVRKLRRQWLERVEWFDPHNGARVQRIVPHEEILFVPLPVN